MLERMEGRLGEHHAGELKRESAEARAERIVAEDLKRQRARETEWLARRKSDPAQLALAGRLRRETTSTMGWIARRLQMGTRKSAAMKLHRWGKEQAETTFDRAKLWFDPSFIRDRSVVSGTGLC